MPSLRWSIFVFVAACSGRCQPDLPSDDDVTNPDTDTGDTDTGDTDPVVSPPCDLPEVEPNGASDQALFLGLDVEGCGTFGTAYDADNWRFDVDEAGWLSVFLRSNSIGSRADPVLVLTSEGGLAVTLGDWSTGEDIELVFPTPADRYTALLTAFEGEQFGADHRYEILASKSKEPISYTTEEREPNGSWETAQPSASGDRVFGGMGQAGDRDRYALYLPPGKQTVRLHVEAYAAGSAGDFTLGVYRVGGEEVAVARFGELGWEPDPWLELASTIEEVWYVQVWEDDDRYSSAHWYVLELDVEGL